MSVTAYLVLLTRPVKGAEFSRCYDDVGICLWADDTMMSQSEARSVCQRRNSFLPRITNSKIQSKFGVFRSDEENPSSRYVWFIDVNEVDFNDFRDFHWIDGSSLPGWSVLLPFTSCRHYDSIDRLSSL